MTMNAKMSQASVVKMPIAATLKGATSAHVHLATNPQGQKTFKQMMIHTVLVIYHLFYILFNVRYGIDCSVFIRRMSALLMRFHK